MDIGYARVSTGEQTLDLQLDAVTKAGCGTVYRETASGAKADQNWPIRCWAIGTCGSPTYPR
jgi:DNA invertase Pin-like site-specific DNA recombinase